MGKNGAADGLSGDYTEWTPHPAAQSRSYWNTTAHIIAKLSEGLFHSYDLTAIKHKACNV